MKFLKITGFILLFLMLFSSIFVYRNLRNRHPGYEVNLHIINHEKAPFLAGFSRASISPEIHDDWVDANGDARYSEEDGDSYVDKNGNGKFDAVWMAGFHNRRPAKGIHDDLWARTMILDDGTTRISFTVVDAIGLMHDEVIEIRKRLGDELGLDYVTIAATHTHEAPDLMGLWGESEFKNGINPDYQEYVFQQIIISIQEAVKNLQPAYLKFARDLDSLKPFVTDSRKPEVLDDGLRILQAIDADSQSALGTVVLWGNHPETLWSDNLQITSDFPHYLRESVENGIHLGDSLIMEGIGGTCIFVNGAIGGLMTTLPDFPVQDFRTGKIFTEPSFEKAEAQGMQIASATLKALRSQEDTLKEVSISLVAKTFDIPLVNPLFRLGASLGLLDRGMTGMFKVQSEVAAIRIGPAMFVTTPGEIYPEIVNGGIEAPEGQDYPVQPLEVPPIRDAMQAEYRFVLGLANDEIGYIIPKSEWDEEAPHIYGYEESPYGEINSMGPETAAIIHGEIMKIIAELDGKK